MYDLNTTTNARSAASHLGAVVPAQGELQNIIERLHSLTSSIEDQAALLRVHADLLRGEVPVGESSVGPSPVRSGLIGGLHDALDRLERARGYLSEQTDRTCSIA